MMEYQGGGLQGSAPDPEMVVATRTGDVLLKATLLKSDHFPGCQNMKLVPLIEGAPNFRQVPGLPVYGVAIPTISGLRLILDALGAQQGQRKVLWHNMREEPVIYINGRPYVVREASRPFANLEYTGIDRTRVEDMEARLKSDVLREAARYGNQIMVAHEDDNFQVLQSWEAVTEADVQTPLDVYRELAEDGYDVEYVRVPVTDEKAPKERDFALLTKRLWHPPEGAALVFNCQMGRGRTTTGMIIASLLQLRRRHAGLALPKEPVEGLPPWFVERALVAHTSGPLMAETELRQGRFGAVRSLLRVLEGGGAAKGILDLVVDACSAMQNLREAITSYRGRLMAENNEEKKNDLLQVCLEYLERYYVLTSFTAFLFGPSFDPASPNYPSFGEWSKQRPELQSVLQRMLRRNPLQALALHRPPAAPVADRLDGASDDESENAALDSAAVLIANRRGGVLGPHTVLKEDHFPGCQAPRVPANVPGAPNFWGVANHNVYGSALPTVAGVRGVLEAVGCAPGVRNRDGEEVRALWYNMREEVTVYINGEPFVLREEERPFKNMQEYTGIDVVRLERMEARLKQDVLEEAAGNPDGQVLVAREVVAERGQRALPPSTSNIIDTYLHISGPDAVQTPREVYEGLRESGYRVDYRRLPLTDGKAPRASSFDAIFDGVSSAGPQDPVIINCQMGGGRTTTAMVVAILVRIFTLGNGRVADLDEDGEGLGGLSPRSVESDDVMGTEDLEEMEASTLSRQPSGDIASRLHISMPPKGFNRVDSLILPGSEEEQEEAALRKGEYVGVRRFTRILEHGNDAKAIVDAVVDRCSAVLNLRQQIMLYRRPSSSVRFFRPEINARHSAFKRGSQYLERYCLLIAFAAYLERNRHTGHVMAFSEWLESRPDMGQALETIHQNPGGALAPVPASRLPSLWVALNPGSSKEVTNEELRMVLSRRRGSTLSRRSILKSHRPDTSRPKALNVEGVLDLRQARGLPIFTLGQCTVQGLRNLLREVGARPGGPTSVIVTDLREELVGYVSGTPYVRRELEMPAAALHHAGIQAVKLEELERRLRADLMKEAIAWGGRVLLHHEVPLAEAMSPTVRDFVRKDSAASMHDDVTRKEDHEPEECVAAFWEPTGDVGDVDRGLATPLEVFQGLALEGYQLTYQRVPLSRERTPEAADLDALHRQALQQPIGKAEVHIVVSRNAAGSSARFVSAFIAAFMAYSQGPPLAPFPTESLAPIGEGSTLSTLPGPPRPHRPISGDTAEKRRMRPVLERSASILGEYRTIMNLVRVLPNGREAKLVVDEAIDRCAPIGNIRDDIHRCKEAAEQGPDKGSYGSQLSSAAVAARRLGLHYLQRYFFLITFFAYIDSANAKTISFSRWMADRRELRHLLSSLTFEAIGDWR